MFLIIGVLVVLGSVAGGFILSHGHLAALWQPYELLIIGGAALGAFLISNPPKVVKAVLGNLPAVFAGSKYDKALYLDLLALIYDLAMKARKDGLMAVEGHIESPEESDIFQKYPKLLKHHHVIEFLCDYMRFMVWGSLNPFVLENLMDVELDTHHEEAELPGGALSKVSDGLPGFGIVAAVLGIVITMSFIGGEPAELGGHIAAALVGTFLGILLAYGFVAPISTAMEHLAREEAKFMLCVKVCLLAMVNGYVPQVVVEFGRKVLYSTERPSFKELEEHLKGAK